MTGLHSTKVNCVSFYSGDHFQRYCSHATSPGQTIFSWGPVSKLSSSPQIQADGLTVIFLTATLFGLGLFAYFLKIEIFLTLFFGVDGHGFSYQPSEISYKQQLLKCAGNSGGSFSSCDKMILPSLSLSLSPVHNPLCDDITYTPCSRKLLIINQKLCEQWTVITAVPTRSK